MYGVLVLFFLAPILGPKVGEGRFFEAHDPIFLRNSVRTSLELPLNKKDVVGDEDSDRFLRDTRQHSESDGIFIGIESPW